MFRGEDASRLRMAPLPSDDNEKTSPPANAEGMVGGESSSAPTPRRTGSGRDDAATADARRRAGNFVRQTSERRFRRRARSAPPTSMRRPPVGSGTGVADQERPAALYGRWTVIGDEASDAAVTRSS